MKILKQGQLPEKLQEWWVGLNLTCKYCSTEVQLEEGDTVETFTERRLGGASWVIWACPTCCSSNQRSR